jgi:type II secretory pathway component PulK
VNSYERDARAIARRRSDRAYTALLEAGVDKSDAADTAARVYDQEFRFELMDAYGETEQTLREDLEVLANCLEVDEEDA